MKLNAIHLLLLALLTTALATAQAQVRKEGDRTPTAEITEEPRSVESLEWIRPNRQDSLLWGGSHGSLPENRVPLPIAPPVCPPEGCDGINPPGGGIPGPAPVDPGLLPGCPIPTGPWTDCQWFQNNGWRCERNDGSYQWVICD